MNSEFRSWDQLSEVEQLQCIYSDAHKDAYGFRPRTMSEEQWNSVEWLRARIDECSAEITRSINEEKVRQAENIRSVEDQISMMIETGAGDRETAIRWMADQYQATDDLDYLCYQLDIPYGYFSKKAA